MILYIILFLIIILIVFTVIDSNRFTVREYTVKTDRVGSDHDLLLLSDLHGKSYGESNRRLYKKINSLKFDMIFSAGDMITAPPTERSFDNSIEFMRNISSYGHVYCSLGNHEYRAKVNKEYYGDLFTEYETILNSFGIKLSDNESEVAGDFKISSLSIPKKYFVRGKKPHMDRDTIERLIGTADEDKFNILLAHDPEYFDAYADWGADLVLSGHLHGGVVRIPFFKGVFSARYTLFPKYDGGLFKKGNSTMVVSRGLGSHTIPVRLFNPAEIVLIHLKSIES